MAIDKEVKTGVKTKLQRSFQREGAKIDSSEKGLLCDEPVESKGHLQIHQVLGIAQIDPT